LQLPTNKFIPTASLYAHSLKKPSENVFEIWLEYQDVGTPCIVFFTITHFSFQLVQMYFNFLSHSPILAALNLHRLLRHCPSTQVLVYSVFFLHFSLGMCGSICRLHCCWDWGRERKRELIWLLVLG